MGYLAFYLAVGQVVDLVFGDRIDEDDVLATAASCPSPVGAAALLLFTARVGWLGEVFGPQPIRGRRVDVDRPGAGAALATVATLLIIVFALVAAFLVRGRVAAQPDGRRVRA